MRRFNKDSRLIIIFLLLVGILAIGYATLGANLKINGVAEVPASSWDVQFKTGSINVTEGSVPIEENTSQKAATIDSATQVSYQVKLPLPGDFYEFTVVVENTGSIDAMIDSVSSKLGNTEITTGTLPSYLDYKVTYSDGVAIEPKQILAANTEETIKVRLEFKKDITANDLPAQASTLNLIFQLNYAPKDNTAIEIEHSIDFKHDSWNAIVRNIKNNNNFYPIGSEKEIAIDMNNDQQDELYTVRLANVSTPNVCNNAEYSQTACGIVIEFVDAVATNISMNNSNSNSGGWGSSVLRSYLNQTFYEKLPQDIKDLIILVDPVVSGSGSEQVSPNVSDKIYLLSAREVGLDLSNDNKRNVDTDTRTLDYYVEHSDNSSRIKTNPSGNPYWWWLRTAQSNSYGFFRIQSNGTEFATKPAWKDNITAAIPAFRIG